MSSIELEISRIRISNDKYEYRHKDKIGSGSFGCVYKVKDKLRNKK
jgi:hypothetical protein